MLRVPGMVSSRNDAYAGKITQWLLNEVTDYCVAFNAVPLTIRRSTGVSEKGYTDTASYINYSS